MSDAAPDQQVPARQHPDGEPTVSVVMACRNAEKFVGQQLDALAAQVNVLDWELVVADNGSCDRTLQIVEDYRDRLPRVVLVDASARIGPAACAICVSPDCRRSRA